jgi:hypothetical protein
MDYSVLFIQFSKEDQEDNPDPDQEMPTLYLTKSGDGKIVFS